MFILGLVFGFGAALGQSIGYVISRQMVVAHSWTMTRVFVHSHTMLGAATGIMLLWLWPGDVPIGELIGPLLLATLSYMIGQLCLFYALHFTQASRVGPLLGLKTAMVALLAITVTGIDLTLGQWGAVGIITAAAFMLNYSGGSNPWRAVVFVLLACFFYAVCDLGIRGTVNAVQTEARSRVLASVISMFMVYTLSGVLCLTAVPWLGSRDPRRWLQAVPFSVVWLGSQIGMFGAIALVDIVLANILVSTRGVISIVMGAMLAKAGMSALEASTTRGVLIRRTIAAVMMIVAIALYTVSGPSNQADDEKTASEGSRSHESQLDADSAGSSSPNGGVSP